MFTDQFKHELNSYLKGQGEKLLAHQSSIAGQAFKVRSGQLMSSLGANVEVTDAKVSIPYPVHIRFLDMKKVSRGRSGRRKKRNYTPIYNKYVYGYLKSDVWRTLNAAIPKQMVKVIEDNFKSVKRDG